ncbi:hypothetical protein A2U01_0035629, partial [Trifolium medium]|nr:hypothetical protein [Trifolium medium]
MSTTADGSYSSVVVCEKLNVCGCELSMLMFKSKTYENHGRMSKQDCLTCELLFIRDDELV